MIGGQEDPPGVVDEQQQFQADRPLHGVDEVASLVGVGDDAAAGLVLDVEVAPLAAGELVEQVLPGAVGGDRDGVAEQDGAGVAVRLGWALKYSAICDRLGAHRVPVVAAVGVELQVGHVGAVAFEHLHGFERGGDVARRAEVVAVQVQRVRQAQLIDDLGQAGDDLRRRDLAVAGDRLVQLLGVLAPLPGRDAAGVDRLDAVDLGRPDEPGDDVLGPLELAGFQQVEDDLVVGHQQAAGLVDDRRVAQLFVRVLGGEDRHRRLDDGGVAHAGVEVAGGEGGRRRPADARRGAPACAGTGVAAR